jgi:hypothetical protein
MKNVRTNGVTRMTKRTIAIVLTVLLAACGASDGSPVAPGSPGTPSSGLPQTNPLGTYNVSSINAKPLPVAIFTDSNYTYEVTAGTMSLAADGSYLSKLTSRQTIAGRVDVFLDSTFGKWKLSGAILTFTNGQDTTSIDHATWEGNSGTLTFVEAEGKTTNTYVYTFKP